MMHLPAGRTAVAPEGPGVRALLGLAGGGMAHFEMAAGRTSGTRGKPRDGPDDYPRFVSSRGAVSTGPISGRFLAPLAPSSDSLRAPGINPLSSEPTAALYDFVAASSA